MPKCQFCGYEPPNIRDDDGNDTGVPDVWPDDRCPRAILPPPAACGIPLEAGKEPLLTDPAYCTRDDLMQVVRTEAPHLSTLREEVEIEEEVEVVDEEEEKEQARPVRTSRYAPQAREEPARAREEEGENE